MQFFLQFFSPFTEKNKSYVISSFVETKGEAMISKTAVEFVEYPLRVPQMLSSTEIWQPVLKWGEFVQKAH